jgi:hypothetical protein
MGQGTNISNLKICQKQTHHHVEWLWSEAEAYKGIQ